MRRSAFPQELSLETLYAVLLISIITLYGCSLIGIQQHIILNNYYFKSMHYLKSRLIPTETYIFKWIGYRCQLHKPVTLRLNLNGQVYPVIYPQTYIIRL